LYWCSKGHTVEKLIEEMALKMGKSHGDGQLQMKAHYKDGQGSLLELYDENGKLISTI